MLLLASLAGGVRNLGVVLETSSGGWTLDNGQASVSR